jgi:tight adherence protein C
MPLPILAGELSILYVVGLTFVLMVAATLLATTPLAETPAARLARYAILARPAAPGARVEVEGFGDRLFHPLLKAVTGAVVRWTPPVARRAAAARLTMAGMKLTPELFMVLRTVFFLGLPALVLHMLLQRGSIDTKSWAALALSVLVGRKLPDIWLKRRVRARQRAIDRGLPYALDLMVACLEGGLSLEASLAKVAEQSDGPLAAEIRLTLQEIQLGRPAVEALRAMGERAGAPDLKRFTASVVQAERMGVAISDMMRTLAQESRVRRRQKAEEMARKAPIKMIPVLIFCILPSLMIVIMMPAVLMVMQIFASQNK